MKYENIDEKYAWKIPTTPVGIQNLPTINDEMEYYHFDVTEIDLEKFLSENDFFNWLYSNYRFRCGIVKMNPYQIYDWHIDVGEKRTNRGVCINALISESPSMVLFSENLENLASQGGTSWQAGIIPFTYEFEKVYLFNPTIQHSVYNFEKTRYLFSLQFELDYTQLSYEGLKSQIRNEYLICS